MSMWRFDEDIYFWWGWAWASTYIVAVVTSQLVTKSRPYYIDYTQCICWSCKQLHKTGINFTPKAMKLAGESTVRNYTSDTNGKQGHFVTLEFSILDTQVYLIFLPHELWGPSCPKGACKNTASWSTIYIATYIFSLLAACMILVVESVHCSSNFTCKTMVIRGLPFCRFFTLLVLQYLSIIYE